MTKLTDAYDAFRALAGTTLTGYKELPNPYIIETNSSLFLQSGYGVSYGVGANSSRRANGSYTGDHELTLTLTKLVSSTENDIAGFIAIKEAMFTIADTFIKAVESNPTLTGATANIDWTSYGQIDFIIDENGVEKFIALPLNFRVQYFET